MKSTLYLFGLLTAILAVPSARAAVPGIYYTVDSFYLGSSVTFAPTVADDDMDMDYVTFSVSGPGVTGWSTLSPDINVPSVGQPAQQTGVTVSKSWTPSVPGLWTVSITVHSLNGSATLNRTFDVLEAGIRTINPVTVGSGSSQIFQYSGEIVTATNNSGDSVVVDSGGALILWSGGRIKLEPGFKAKAGVSLFWAAIDHNMNGYSDMEELQQNFIPGVPDAWLADHGVNLSLPMSSWAYTPAQYLAAYQGGYDPSYTNAASTTTYPLVLRAPSGQYYGVQTSTWAITDL
jgi:hypothetical protein